MKPTSTVYVLEPNLTDPKLNGFVYAAYTPSCIGFDDACDDFHVEDGESLDWKPYSLKKTWKPINVEGPTKPFNDYPCLELSTPVFSRRAVEALGEMLTDNGELLPLKNDVGDYFAYVVMTKLDVLNVSKCVIHRTSKTRSALAIDYFDFKKSKLAGASIFRVREHPNEFLVTEQFKERAEEAALNGLNFIKVWPLPEGSDWGMDEAVRRRTNKIVTLVGEGLTICFSLKKDKPNASEKEVAGTLVTSLRAKLLPASIERKYWGSVEKAEFADGEFRLICSCPSCDTLFDYISDWVSKSGWPNEVAAIKRYGNLYFGRPKEKRVKFGS